MDDAGLGGVGRWGGQGFESGGLGDGEGVVAEGARGVGRAAAGFGFVIDDLGDGAVLEEHALVGLDAVSLAGEEAGDGDVGRVLAVVVDAGVAVVGEADLDGGVAGTADEDAEVGSEDDVGELAGVEVGFDGTVVERDHETRVIGGGMCGIESEGSAGGRAEAEMAATGEGEPGRACARCDRAAGADRGAGAGDGERSGEGEVGVEVDERDGLGGCCCGSCG